MKEFYIELKDTKNHTYMEYPVWASDMLIAIQDSIAEAYKVTFEYDTPIYYVTVTDGDEKYIYSTVDKALVKYY